MACWRYVPTVMSSDFVTVTYGYTINRIRSSSYSEMPERKKLAMKTNQIDWTEMRGLGTTVHRLSRG